MAEKKGHGNRGPKKQGPGTTLEDILFELSTLNLEAFQVSRKDYLQLLLDAQTSEKLQDIERNEANYLSVRLDKKLTIEVSGP